MLQEKQFTVYHGKDLGLTKSTHGYQLRIWSPVAAAAEIIFYDAGYGGNCLGRMTMNKADDGTWIINFGDERTAQYYTVRIFNEGHWSNEVADPYAKFTGVNGRRAMVADIQSATPPGWNDDAAPGYFSQQSGAETADIKSLPHAIIYELHIRDISVHRSSGVSIKGKYISLTERGTVNQEGLSTTLDHLVETGITHVQILPVFDFCSVDEGNENSDQYNWGYDPLNFNTPEGSYATNAFDGRVRVFEFRQMIMALHSAGIRVVIDMAYNHTALRETSAFEQLVPGYFYRKNRHGDYASSTGCGNETASEKPMVRKFIIDSMIHWVEDFHIDGFRIDLMGVHDLETMNEVSRSLRKIRPDILLYGEGWAANNSSPLPETLRAVKHNVAQLENIAVFSDDIRDGIKGSVFRYSEKGFVSAQAGLEETIKFGITAACYHPQVDYRRVNYSDKPYAKNPEQVINYCDCHDNHNLFDKLAIAGSEFSEEDRVNMQMLSLAIVLTSQGIPFLHAGSEFLRSKGGVENSFNAGDSINAIDWALKSKHKLVFEFVRRIIELRKDHPVFRLPSAASIEKNIHFIPNRPGLVAYTIDGRTCNDAWLEAFVIFNGSEKNQQIVLPLFEWHIAISQQQYVSGEVIRHFVMIKSFSCLILYRMP
ncbi:type I pullulanase [Pollutibacter soli]|uniref:type I pullulanase n=1 Tax=Pollutibacter soli TaxID=3034157 RepID=UPI003013BAAA